ncbi:MAG: molecular chaperone HtpG [Clostridia bacterium]|nr:molecular chaperone HtpG [Clostridia bacterium]
MQQFKAQSKKLLDLVVNSIYVNREIFLRELISNASDALDKRRFMSLTDSSLSADFCIEIKLDKDNRSITISDNGVGMSEKELEENLGVIAASGTEAFKKSRDAKEGEELIGQFGVGFYSAFMVADRVTVISRKAGENEAHAWISDGVEGFDIMPAVRADCGTDIILTLKADDGEDKYSDFLESYGIRGLVKKYSDYIRYPIKLELPPENDSDTEKKFDVINSMTPVWKKQKSELGENELDEFYKHAYRDYRAPLFSITSRVEGSVNYTALLFVPSEPSYDYYTKEYKRGLSLYCNGVMIMECCEALVPEYLGFVRGVVDTSDLALNISRETLQHDRRLKAISQGIEKKILSEFAKLLKNDREKYEKMFGQFGKALKFGAYADFGVNKDKLKDLLLFYSDSHGKLVTLRECVDGLKNIVPIDDAERKTKAPILYACGETTEKISMLPQLELAHERGDDVLYFTEPVDEFIARMLVSYDGHKFENVASGDVKDDDRPRGSEGLLRRIEAKLKGKASVAATSRLKSYPVCLAAKGDVSLEMERVMSAMGNSVKAERVLQVNVDHPAVKNLKKLEGNMFDDAVTVLYNEALLAEGYHTEPEFLPAVNRLLGLLTPEAEDAAANKRKRKPRTVSKTDAIEVKAEVVDGEGGDAE